MTHIDAKLQSASTAEKHGAKIWTYRVVMGFAPVIDALSILLVSTGTYLFFAYGRYDVETFRSNALAIVIFIGAVVLLFNRQGLYDFKSINRPIRQVVKTILTCAVVFATLLSLAYAFKIGAEFSRLWTFSTFIGATALLCVHRFAFYHLIRKCASIGLICRRIAIVGWSEQARRFLEMFDADGEMGGEPWNRVIGIFDDRRTRISPTLGKYLTLGRVDDLIRLIRRQEVDDVVVALPWNAEERVADTVSRLSELPVHIHLGPDLAASRFPEKAFFSIGGTTVLNVIRKPLDGWGGILKAVEDRLLAVAILTVFGPLMLAIALAIKVTSPGPIFFRQLRYGFNNEIINVFKFRTMYHNRGPETGVPQATKGDPRVTAVGRILRKTSLDELPQILNVLEGSMSLVGPRPHAVAHNEEFAKIIDGYFARHRVKPGITGWAQVNGLRGETDTPEKMAARVRYDIYYIDNWSLLFDLKILLRTLLVGFVHPNAY